MSITAMKQALEALEKHYPYEDESGIIKLSLGRYFNGMQYLRQAIEQAEKQEPVAWLCERDGQGYSFAYTAEQLHQLGYGNISVPPFRKVAPLYTTPQPQREWVGLTLDEKKEYLAQDFGGSRADAMDWAEQRLKEKNT
jgi:hypothetical protein